MGKRTGRPVGRPAGPAEARVQYHQVCFPPDVWEELCRRVPAGERSRYICGLLKGAWGREDRRTGKVKEQARVA